ncbi:MAG TPA: hypothetical protein H9680_08550 [Firmicutes bacterium]|nr:hypothetical protein [Bacillota bacterium]
MTITEKVAYLKGLAEGMKLNADTPEGKMLLAIVDVLDDMALTVEDLDDGFTELSAQVDEIDEDLGSLEEDCYGEECGCDDEDEEDECDCCGDEVLYEVECPSCGNTICINESMLEEGEMECPNCHELLEFDIQDEDEDTCECGECSGCDKE